MKRAGLGLGAVWLLSAAPLFLPQTAELELSPFALAAGAWLVLATLPRTSSERTQPEWLALLLAAPPLALALALEHARGRALGASLAAAGILVLLALGFGMAAERSARSTTGRRVYAAAWFALVAGAPLLARTLESVGAPLFGRAPQWLAWTARLSPLESWCSMLRASPEWPWAALALAAGLWLAARVAEARA